MPTRKHVWYRCTWFRADDPDFVCHTRRLQRVAGRRSRARRPTPVGRRCPSRRGGLPADAGRGVPARGRVPRLGLPILVLTSEFGTLSMWDWEIISYLRAEGVEMIAPYNWTRRRCLPRAGRQAPAARRPSSSSTRTTRARGSRRASSSGSTGGRTSARSGSARSSA